MTEHRPYAIVDGHSDFVNRIRDLRRAGVAGSLATEYLPALREGGVRVAIMQAGGDSGRELEHGSMASALEKISYLYAEVSDCPGIEILRDTHDLDTCLKNGNIGVVLMLEGAKALIDDIAYVSVYHQLGTRMIALTWNRRNLLADGCGENDLGCGLTSLGKEVVQEMGRLNVILDVSHLSDACTWDSLAVASGPVVASHSGVREVCHHVRNVPDDQLRAIAETGGLVGINFFPRFLRASGRPTGDDLVSHIDHAVNVAGEDAVGLGPDFVDYMKESTATALLASSVDYGSDFTYPVGFESTSDLASMPDLLSRAGYPESRIEKILSGNWLRVLRGALA